jgi:hypothetical protein
MDDARKRTVSLIPVVDELLEVSMSLPDGWTVEVDGGSRLTCVADDAWECDGFRPSITVERYPHRSRDQVSELAEAMLAKMRESPDVYPDFQLRWRSDDTDSGRVVRCYNFVLPGTRQAVRQVQGLISGDGLFVVNCSEAADHPSLENSFVDVVRSVVV